MRLAFASVCDCLASAAQGTYDQESPNCYRRRLSRDSRRLHAHLPHVLHSRVLPWLTDNRCGQPTRKAE